MFFIKFWRSILQKVKGHPHDISINSFRSSSSTATPMLSFVMTLFSIASDPSEFAIASWLNSTVCFWTKVNLKQKQKQTQKTLKVNFVLLGTENRVWIIPFLGFHCSAGTSISSVPLKRKLIDYLLIFALEKCIRSLDWQHSESWTVFL